MNTNLLQPSEKQQPPPANYPRYNYKQQSNFSDDSRRPDSPNNNLYSTPQESNSTKYFKYPIISSTIDNSSNINSPKNNNKPAQNPINALNNPFSN